MANANAEMEKLVRSLGMLGRQRLIILLTPESSIGNWKNLAEKMGFQTEDIDYFATKPEPVDYLLTHWAQHQGQKATLNKLQEFIQSIGREDVVEDLQKFIDEMPAQSKDNDMGLKVDSKIIGTRDIEGEDENVTVSDQIYDALICYAKEDMDKANDLLKALEAAPYNFKICINYRDFGVGGDHLTQLATIIEERVKRVIVILTENFTSCDECDYQAKVALNLSPGCKEKRIIPILYGENLKIPKILKHITALSYSRPEVQPFFMQRLATSLGYKKNKKDDEFPSQNGASEKQENKACAKTGKTETIEKESCQGGSGKTHSKHGKISLFKKKKEK